GWINLEGVTGDEVTQVVMEQTKPAPIKKKDGYWYMAFDEIHHGWLFYHFGVPNGTHRFDYVVTKNCPLVIVCGDTLYIYGLNDGKPGVSTGASGAARRYKADTLSGEITIREPGVYEMGNYAFKEIKIDNYWDPLSTLAENDKNMPSRKEILEFLLKQDMAKDHPEVADLIRKAMR
ncbi:hypothetical protein ACQV5M_19575, partial [Leptospira sp. SA-E8]|uniref:hypothetical protein n=1 Tax=Leptospira sp. SA-E8 TaxID=3422259 RepID=UPI003EBB53B9